MKKRIATIVFVVVCLLAIGGVALSLGAIRDTRFFRSGAVEGFNLDGVYKDHETGLRSLAFHTEYGKRWQLTDDSGTVTDGSFETTGDPNVYLLQDAAGTAYGEVHVAYVSSDEDDGALYLRNGSDAVRFDKQAKDPAFIESHE